MTEKDYNPQQKEKKAMEKEKTNTKIEEKKIVETPKEVKKQETKDKKINNKKEIIKKPEKNVPKKTEAIVNAVSLPISTKYSVAICRFIRGKKIENAIADLEQVILHKKAIPMKGEIPHRKGRIMSGRYPKKAVEYFIKLLKSLLANSNANGLDNPIIANAIANLASRPFGRFGRVRKKRTHVAIKAKEKKSIPKSKKLKEKKT